MAPVTEIANIPLNSTAATTIDDVSSEAAKAFASMREYLSGVNGYIRSYWGLSVEEPRRVLWAVDWEDLSSHREFQQSSSYGYYLSLGDPFIHETEKPFITHIPYQPFPPTNAIEAPATEVAMFSVQPTIDKIAVETAVAKLMDVVQHDIPNHARGCSTGWVVEEIEHPDAEGGKALGYACMVGWESVDAHMKARETDAFAQAIAPVRKVALQPLPGKSMLHVHFQKN
ncbi:MAG: hypothetical protein Q9227_002081 [Pyrenula ochraceoflavens]